MTREPRNSPIVPSYGESSLADLSNSILASLTDNAAGNVLGLPETRRGCLLVIGRLRPRARPGAAPRAPGGGAVPGRAGVQLPPADRRVPLHDGDQPGLPRHRPGPG